MPVTDGQYTQLIKGLADIQDELDRIKKRIDEHEEYAHRGLDEPPEPPSASLLETGKWHYEPTSAQLEEIPGSAQVYITFGVLGLRDAWAGSISEWRQMGEGIPPTALFILPGQDGRSHG